MIALINPRLWITLALVIVLAFTHFVSYRYGRATVRAQWEQDKAQRTQQALAAEQAARAREQELIDKRKKLEDRYAQNKRKADAAAAGARTELGRLRDQLAAAGGQTPADPAAPARADAAPSAERAVISECAGALVEMAANADRLSATVTGLQGYVSEVCRAR